MSRLDMIGIAPHWLFCTGSIFSLNFIPPFIPYPTPLGYAAERASRLSPGSTCPPPFPPSNAPSWTPSS